MSSMKRKTQIRVFVVCAIVLFCMMNILVFSLAGYWSKKMKADGLCQLITEYVKDAPTFFEKCGNIVSVSPDQKNIKRMEQISSNEYMIYCILKNDMGSAFFAKLRVIFEDNGNVIENIVITEFRPLSK